MDYYSEYNRIRKNLMQQARRHGIHVTPIPTARQLLLQTGKKKITKSQVKTITTQKKSLQTIVKSQPKFKSKTIKVQTLRVPKPKSSEPKVRKKKSSLTQKTHAMPKSYYKQVSKEHSHEYTTVTSEGILIDKFTKEELGYAGFVPDETVGKHIYEKYYDKENEKFNKSYTETVSEVEMFISDIQSRLTQAFEDLNDKTVHNGASPYAIPAIQSMLDKFETMTKTDWDNAYIKFTKLQEPVKRYIDDALYYIGEANDHARAFGVIANLFGMDEDEISNVDLSEIESGEYDIEEEYTDFWSNAPDDNPFNPRNQNGES